MSKSRIDQALARINAAMSRIDIAQENAQSLSHPVASQDEASSARVMELVNRHEKLREEVADSLRDLDSLIEDLES